MKPTPDTPINGLPPLYYYASLFAPSQHRVAVQALLQYWQTLQQIRVNSSDTGVARLKLQWWQQQWSPAQTTQAGTHPLAEKLATHFRQEDFPHLAALSLYQDKLMRGQQPQQDEEFQQLAHQGYGLLFQLLLKIEGLQANDKQQQILDRLAVCALLAQHVHEMGTEIAQGRCLLSEQRLQKHNLGCAGLHQNSASLTALLEELRKESAQDFSRISCQQEAFRMPMIITHLWLQSWQETARSHYPVFQYQIHLTPVRLLWLAWRMQRRLRNCGKRLRKPTETPNKINVL